MIIIMEVKHGTCQVKVDFLVSSKNLLSITTAGETLLMSAATAGSHVYLHVEEGDMIIVTLAQDEPASPASSVR